MNKGIIQWLVHEEVGGGGGRGIEVWGRWYMLMLNIAIKTLTFMP